MLKHKYLKYFFISFLVEIIISSNVFAINSPILINQIKLGDELSAKNEFVEIYNNTDQDIEITDWCLFYQSITLTDRKLSCFVPTDVYYHVYLPSNQSSILLSNEQFASNSLFEGDAYFSATLSGSGGYVYLTDNLEVEIDRVGWTNDVSSKIYVIAPAPGNIISRKKLEDSTLLQDTDNDFEDFEIIEPTETHLFGAIYEIFDVCHNIDGVQDILPENYFSDELFNCYEMVDYCINIDDLQLVVPEGYELDEDGNCQPDLCPNIDNLQLVLPDEMISKDGDCVYRDFCPNIEGLQRLMPEGYYLNEDGNCMINVINLRLNEILPNVSGIDDGNEFIEIYNPNNFEVDLANYVFKLSESDEKYYKFPDNSIILPNDFYTIYNLKVSFTLKNSYGEIWLLTIDGQTLDSVVYDNPKEGESWSFFENSWQYTNQVTPNTTNLGFLEEIKILNDDLVPCGPNQYRNPETNRCKNIVTLESTLAPCKDGQYRSEETNRCRNIVSDVVNLIPCDEGEERNPETNRCRKIISSVLGDSSLQPCPEGQERNPETNRCKKIVDEIPEADYKVSPVANDSNNYIIWWSIGAVGLIVVLYAIWEWRQEINHSLRRLMNFVSKRK